MTTFEQLQDEALAQARHIITIQLRNHHLTVSDRELDEMAIELYRSNPTLFEAMAMHSLGVKWN